MQRALADDLLAWRDSPRRKPLVLNGARQVGKTWLLRQLGTESFASMAYVSLDSDATARRIFEADLEPARIVRALSLHLGIDIREGETLIVLDEVQSCPRAITSLKYFCEDAPGHAVAAAGSLLGVSATEGTGFPVGKVDSLDLYPLTFLEFLDAVGEGGLADELRSGDTGLMGTLADTYVEHLRRYLVVGGMPEAVLAFAADGDFRGARRVQEQILGDCTRDFAKHVPGRLLARMLLVWESLPRHLARENKKFVFGQVREGARAADFEEALVWLGEAGLVHRVDRISKPGIPLSAYQDGKSFKVFSLDVGLLGAMSGLEPSVVLEGSRIFTEFKGALTEQYVAQELIASCGATPYYWSADNSRGEIDFIVQMDGEVFPIEVKAAENLRSKSLRVFSERFDGMHPRRFSLSGFRDEGWMRNIPLWAIGNAATWAS